MAGKPIPTVAARDMSTPKAATVALDAATLAMSSAKRSGDPVGATVAERDILAANRRLAEFEQIATQAEASMGRAFDAAEKARGVQAEIEKKRGEAETARGEARIANSATSTELQKQYPDIVTDEEVEEITRYLDDDGDLVALRGSLKNEQARFDAEKEEGAKDPLASEKRAAGDIKAFIEAHDKSQLGYVPKDRATLNLGTFGTQELESALRSGEGYVGPDVRAAIEAEMGRRQPPTIPAVLDDAGQVVRGAGGEVLRQESAGVEQAIQEAVKATGVAWEDWTDEQKQALLAKIGG